MTSRLHNPEYYKRVFLETYGGERRRYGGAEAAILQSKFSHYLKRCNFW